MTYQTHKVAMLYFRGALAFFLCQFVFYLVVALHNGVPDITTRMIADKNMTVWPMIGLVGATCFVLPEETGSELVGLFVAKLQFWLSVVVAVGYLFYGRGDSGFVERLIENGIIVVCMMFLSNVTMTVIAGRKTAVAVVLTFGLWFGMLIVVVGPYTFGLFSSSGTDMMEWFYVVQFWLQAALEVIMASVLAFLMIKLNGINRSRVNRWLYVIVGLIVISRLYAINHDNWLFTAGYWNWLKFIYAAVVDAPLFVMMVFAVVMMLKPGRRHPNRAALLWVAGAR